MSKVTTLTGGHLSGWLLVGNMTLSTDGLTSFLPSHTSLSLWPQIASRTCNFLHWVWRTPGRVCFGHPPLCTASLNRSSSFCFAFKLWCNKNGIISRQSTCLSLCTAEALNLFRGLLEPIDRSPLPRRGQCAKSMLYFLQAFFMLVFLLVKMSGKQGRIHLHPL